MLFARATKYGAGLTLWGDYYDLRAAYDTIGYFFDRSAIQYRLREHTMGLAHGIRLAYEGRWLQEQFGVDEVDRVTYRGASFIWPLYLSQIALVRQAAAYAPHGRREQALVHILEDSGRTALIDYDPTVGTECAAWIERPLVFPSDYLVSFLDYTARAYVSEGRAGKARFRKLPGVLHSFSPFSAEYKAYADILQRKATEQNCSPQELMETGEWPDFKW